MSKQNIVIITYMFLIALWGTALLLLPNNHLMLYPLGLLIFFSSFFILKDDPKKYPSKYPDKNQDKE